MLHENSYAQDYGNLVNVNFILGSVKKSNIVAGIKFTIKKGWHIYYKDPGDIGLPTTFTWTNNIKTFNLHWPNPSQHIDKINNQNFYSNIYTGTIIFPISFTTQDNQIIELKISYAVCKSICIPKSHTLTLNKLPKDFSDQKTLNLINKWKNQ
ncbi:protein-disulfide reductase DsbD domain-containing protein [Candidatus Neoehrlichia procyonis]|uniref:Disulfide bond corrector DsbC family protein n=1 Tax=Candidatus Neoehrlichia procyonis str. RAC413 TaxID=1359163 RepID=A0A0F3NLK2_9RICK|nr:protein-disulfide reductase DsbD N-terminal domain-containing protein [Candidatus Neoehrlichia lotoris]KJV68646.1 disulfide bond corrector DsbC family protein [Candidatus Neoehrlichia lotoris str. RAC413]